MNEYNYLDRILAAVYLAGVENGLGRRLTDPEEINHRREAFIKSNPACKEARDLITGKVDTKQRITVAIIVKDGEIISVGTNEHKEPCKREGYPTGEGYELCEYCQYSNHAEANACKKPVNGGHLYLFGHTYCCEPCLKECRVAGIEDITICEF